MSISIFFCKYKVLLLMDSYIRPANLLDKTIEHTVHYCLLNFTTHCTKLVDCPRTQPRPKLTE